MRAACNDIAMSRWVMMHRELGNVSKGPSKGCQIESEQLFLATDKKPRLESSGVKESFATDDRCPSHET
jgi:hypothetical protein